MKIRQRRIACIVVLALLCSMPGFSNSMIQKAAAEENETVCGTPNYEATKQFQGKDDDFRVGISYVSENWDEVIFADFTTTDVMQITKEGDYTISYTTALDDGMKMIWLDTNLYSGSKMKVDVTGMTITSADGTQKNEYSFSNGKLLHPGSLWGYRDSDEEKNYAATILNPYLAYHYYVADYCNNYREEYTSYGFNEWDMIDLFSEKILTLGAGSVIEVAFTVSDVSKNTNTNGNGNANGNAHEKPTATPAPYIDHELWAQKGIHAYVSYQMDSTWDYRSSFTKDTYLSSYSYIRANGKEVDAATTTVKDVFINRDGEYTVGISGINLSASQKYNILQIATDLSVKTEKNGTGIYSGVNISNVSLKVDGVTVEQGLTPVLLENEDAACYALTCCWETCGPLYAAARYGNIAVPMDSIEITFTITGLKAALNDLKNGTYRDPMTGKKVANDTITQEDIDASKGIIPIATVKPTVRPTVKPRATAKSKPKKNAVSKKMTTSRQKAANNMIRPKIKAGAGRVGAIRYISLRLCKYKGTNVIIYYRMKKRGWKRLPLTSSSIRKNRRRFRIRCSSRRQTYYFRVKTYRKVRGKKVKSVYSNVAKVSIR